MKVVIPSPLADYTAGRREIEGEGDTLDTVLKDLDLQYAGIRFRMIDEQGSIRAHIKLFINGVLTKNLSQALRANDELIVVAALSGG